MSISFRVTLYMACI